MKVYVSCPMVVPQTTLDKILKELNASNDILALAYPRGEMYTTRNLEESDALVIVHPENKFKFNQRTLPNGVLKEFNRARLLAKKIYLCYFPQTGNNVPYFYSIDYEVTNGNISGIAGTSGSLFSMAENANNKDYDICAAEEVEKLREYPSITKSIHKVLERYESANDSPMPSESYNVQKSLPLLIG